jgi:hypothetical protein
MTAILRLGAGRFVSDPHLRLGAGRLLSDPSIGAVAPLD